MYLTKLKVSGNEIWLGFSLSILVFPLFPALGALGLVIIMLTIWGKNYSEISKSRLNQGLGIVAILLIFSSVFAEYPQEAYLGLANFLPFFALFVALRYLITQQIQLKQLSWLLILPSLPIAILGWGQLFAGWQSPAWIASVLGWKLVPLGIPPGRMSSVFIYANFLAIYLAIAYTLAFGLWLETWQSWSKRRTKLQIPTISLLTVIILADIGGLILTSSRNAWGLAVFSFMAYAGFLGWRWLVWGVTGAATAVLWASFLPSLGGSILRRIVPSFIWTRLSDQLYERPVETLRITQWQFCWDLIKERPWFGWGLRNFTPLYEADKNFWFGHPHNLFLMLGAESGLITTLLLLTIVGSIMFQAVVVLENWSGNDSKLIFFSYAIAFSCFVLFNLADVTIFDLRVNTLAWVLLGAISGVSRTKSVK